MAFLPITAFAELAVNLKFDETGFTAGNSGTLADATMLNSNGFPSDLHTASALGVSGLVGDRAFDARGNFGSVGPVTQASYDLGTFSQFTITGWLNRDSDALALGADQAYQNLMRFEKDSVNRITLQGYGGNGATVGDLQLRIGSATGSSFFSPSSYQSPDEWVFFAVTFDGTPGTNVERAKWYVADTATTVVSAGTNSSNIASGSFEFDFGATTMGIGNADSLHGQNRIVDGLMDDFRFYTNEILGPAEIELIRREALPPTTELTSTFVAEDPGAALPGHVSNVWRLDTAGAEWLSSELRVELGVGAIYQDADGSEVPPDPAEFGARPSLQFDSYLTGGFDSKPPSYRGNLPVPVGGAIDVGGASAFTFDNENLNATWVTEEPSNLVGDLSLARVTLTDDAQGWFRYRLGMSGGFKDAVYAEGMIVDGVMHLQALPLLPGDFNYDGAVNAADYVVWRDLLDAESGSLGPNDTAGGMIGTAQYELWRSAYGATRTGVVGTTIAPEPSALVAFIVAVSALALNTRIQAR
ncbi:hypothetical protein Pla123a_43610 [Posidoniimonas polymericola]|uniref:LamG-like jellyroll fold domain-containing protein n=1 Tax=Posidoniimonas polymericola TaxID=2528002 RepID=A0A5C5XZM5_9BACT|nr:LamG-like jellyroll fold domain-containing protein [Posidoniimonas polymericola]TWT66932.1 hypothetical protein Pla123a_43610 [Posidoniimonas polymericola]